MKLRHAKQRQKQMLTFIALLLAVFIHSAIAQAQPREGRALDKIVAVVGTEIILKSDVTARIMYLAQGNPAIDPNSGEIFSEVLQGLIDEKLVVVKAIEDSIVVSEDEISNAIDFQIDRLVREYGSQERVENVYGLSIASIRRDFRETMRKTLLGQKLAQQKFFNLKATPKEVEEFYKAYVDSLSIVPPQVELYHIVKNVQKGTNVKDDILRKARLVRDSIVQQGDFAAFARRHSEDYHSAQNGGNLGVVKRGSFISEFEAVAFKLQEGQISEPVETPFGYHIIQLDSKKANEIEVSHILFKLGQSSDDVENAKHFLDSLRGLVLNGKVDFEELARKHSDEESTKAFGGYMERKWRISELSSDLQIKISTMQEGDITEPLTYPKNPNTPAFHIVYLKRSIPEHKMSMEDDYEFVEDFAVRDKRQRLTREWLADLREEIYWEIREE